MVFQNAAADENQLLSGAESQQAEVRVAFGESQGQAQEPAPAQDQAAAASEDQQAAAQTNSASIDEISLDDADGSEENRNKRWVLLCDKLTGSKKFLCPRSKVSPASDCHSRLGKGLE